MRWIVRIIKIALLGVVGLVALAYALAFLYLYAFARPAPYDEAKLESLLVEARRIDEQYRAVPRDDLIALTALTKDVKAFQEKDQRNFYNQFPAYPQRLTREQAQAIDAEYGATMRDFSARLGAILADGLDLYYDCREEWDASIPLEQKMPYSIFGGYSVGYYCRTAQVDAALGDTERAVALLEQFLDYYHGNILNSIHLFGLLSGFENAVSPTVVHLLPQLSVPQMQRLSDRLETLPSTRPMMPKVLILGMLQAAKTLEWPAYREDAQVRATNMRKGVAEGRMGYLPWWKRVAYWGRLLAPLRDRYQWLQQRTHMAHHIDFVHSLRALPDAPPAPVDGEDQSYLDMIRQLDMFDEQKVALRQIVDRAIARKASGDAAPLEGDFPALVLDYRKQRTEEEPHYKRGALHYVIADDYGCLECTISDLKCALPEKK